jgi:hypothetical protein
VSECAVCATELAGAVRCPACGLHQQIGPHVANPLASPRAWGTVAAMIAVVYAITYALVWAQG